MAKESSTKSAPRAIWQDQRGNTAVLFALSIVPLLLACGGAIDYLRYVNARTEIQAALDAGALAVAAAADLSNAQRIDAGEEMFARGLSVDIAADASLEASFVLKETKVIATASYELPASLMRVAGFNAMPIDVEAEIVMPESKKAEIALVLDYSGSMADKLAGQVKYVAMKNAAKSLVSDLAGADPKKVKIGLVPFSHHVWTSLPKDHVLGAGGAGTWTGCTQDRPYPANLTDATPTAANATKWGQPNAPVHASSGCGPYVPKNLVVKPLSDDFGAINAQLDAMKPYAWTHIALGAEFGFHLLSPNAPFGEGVSYGDKKTQKFLVLLTDGMQTEPAFGPSGVRSVAQGEKNLTAICANAKAMGITVVAIAYNIDDADTVSRLKNCTTDPATGFFDIGTDNKIAGAFDAIKNQIMAQIRIGK